MLRAEKTQKLESGEILLKYLHVMPLGFDDLMISVDPFHIYS